MKAPVLNSTGALKKTSRPLEFVDLPVPEPQGGQVLVRV